MGIFEDPVVFAFSLLILAIAILSIMVIAMTRYQAGMPERVKRFMEMQAYGRNLAKWQH